MADEEKKDTSSPVGVAEVDLGDVINTSGHVQELDRQFGFWSICAASLTIDNAWGASAGSLTTALYDGGGPGVLYTFLVACSFYCFIGAGLAELASAIPSSASVYHWASVTSGKYGRVSSWYAGWWNYFAWNFGCASASLFGANAILGMYSLFHDGFVPDRWMIFIAYLGVTWMGCGIVLFGQRVLAKLTNAFGFLCLTIWLVSLLVVAILPSTTGKGYASHSFVWKDWNNQVGYSSNGFVFCLGMLNGAFGIGTPDGCTHLAEEIPDPKRNIPKGIVAQLVGGILTTFTFYIALLYAITNLDTVLDSAIPNLPLAAIYLQATNSNAGTCGLLVLFLIDIMVTLPGAYMTASRMLWTLARDDALPYSSTFAHVSPRFRNPFASTIACGCVSTILGCVYIGSTTAFNAFVGVFTILTTMSYLCALLPHLLTKRKYVIPGPFWMPPKVAYPVIGIACAYIIVFNIIYMFPYYLPTDAESMNYSCLLSGGLTIFVSLWYLWKRNHGYIGPMVALEAKDDVQMVEGNLELEEKLDEKRRLEALKGLQARRSEVVAE